LLEDDRITKSAASHRGINRQPAKTFDARSAFSVVGDLTVLLVISSIAALTALSTLDVPAAVRVTTGLIAGLFIPGYAAVSVIFPQRSSLEGLARISLSCVLSLAIMTFAALALELFSTPVTGKSLVATITSASIILVMFATMRRIATPVDERFGPVLPTRSVQPRREWSRRARWAGVVAAFAALTLLGSAVTLLASYTSDSQTTEFALLNSAGEPEFYERFVRPGESTSVTLEVINKEGKPQDYAIHIATENEVLGEPILFTLDAGETWSEQVEFTPPVSNGLHSVSFELYRGTNITLGEPYRWLRLMIAAN
jgi:uncharacterized membrane protein